MVQYSQKVQTAFVVLALIITLYFQFTEDRSLQSIAFFGLIIIITILYFVYIYIKDKFSQIEVNSHKIKQLEEKLDYHRELGSMKTKLALLEERIEKKKGQIKPEIVILFLLLVVLLLYLKSINVI